jgi:hypothetical protein
LATLEQLLEATQGHSVPPPRSAGTCSSRCSKAVPSADAVSKFVDPFAAADWRSATHSYVNMQPIKDTLAAINVVWSVTLT